MLPEVWPAGAPFDDADYEDVFSESAPHASTESPEQWARYVLEGASRPMRTFLRLGWRYGLGFRPVRRDAVLGWPAVAQADGWVILRQDSWLFGVALLMRASEDRLTWATRVKYESPAARPAWRLIGIIHRRFAPRALRRALAQAQGGSSGPSAR